MASSYPLSFYFELLFKKEKIPFQEISGISAEVGVEEVICGGESRFKYKLPTIAASQNLVLKRAVPHSGSELVKWCKNSIGFGKGFNNNIVPVDVSVNLLDENSQPCMSWIFYKAYPVKYSVSDLKSQESGILIESIDLAYTYFELSQ